MSKTELAPPTTPSLTTSEPHVVASERLSVVSNDTAGRFLINMIAVETPRQDVLNKFRFSTEPGQTAMADVALTINGVPVNFTRAINDMWERLTADYDEDVKKAAKELIRSSRFNELSHLLERIEWSISAEIEKLFPSKGL